MSKAALHTEVDTFEIGWKNRSLLHAMIDLGLIKRVECHMEDCRYPTRELQKSKECRSDGAFLSFDHLTPRSEGGNDRLQNLRPAHRYCNSYAARRVKKEETE